MKSDRLGAQVYFVDDPYDPEWKVVRYKDPRSRRVIGGIAEASLSAPGRGDATHMSTSSEQVNGSPKRHLEPILEANVVHVMAHEEVDEEAAYEEVDHMESESDDESAPTAEDTVPPVPVRDVIDDA